MDFRLLGPLEVAIEGRQLDIGPPLRRALCAVLALNVGRVVPIDHLIDVLWEHAPESARGTLISHVSRLRSILHTTSPGVEISTVGSGYALHAPAEYVDVHRFRRAITTGRGVTDPFERAEALRSALAMWRGPALADVGDHTRERVGASLDSLYLSVLADRIDADLACSRHRALVPELTDLVADHPTREQFVGQLMVAMHRSGDTADAINIYGRTRQHLAREFGVDPGPELQKLFKDIISGDARGEAARTAPTEPATPAFTTEEPTSPHVSPAQLPMITRGFTGRTSDLAWLDRTSLEKSATLIVVSGMAGTGKTMLALRWAHQIAQLYPDGQLYVDLRGHTNHAPMSAREAISVLLAGLNVQPAQIPVDEIASASLLRSVLSGRRILLLLDNARSAAQIRPLLPGTSACLVIATSRHALDDLEVYEGAARLHLDAMKPDEAAELLALTIGGDAPRSTIDEVVRLCGYLPLAMRIAGARMRGLTSGAVRRYIDELAGRHRLDALEIHGSDEIAVRTAFAISYRHLAPGPRDLFAMLGLLPGRDFGVEAIAALLDVSIHDAERGIAVLVSANLVHRQDNGRYRLHDLIAEYAAELATEVASRPAVLDRLYEWYLRGATVAAAAVWRTMVRLPSTLDPAGALAADHEQLAARWLDLEYPSLLAAVRDGRLNDQAYRTVRIADALRGYLYHHGTSDVWIAIATVALSIAESTSDTIGHAAAELNLATAHGRMGDYAASGEHLQRTAQLSQSCGWHEGEIASITNLGLVAWHTGDLQKAVALQSRAITINTHPGAVRNAHHNLGITLLDAGRLNESLEHLSTALELTSSKDPFGFADTNEDLGLAYRELGDLDSARTHLECGLSIHREFGSIVSIRHTVASLAIVALDQGDIREATALIESALDGPQANLSDRTHAYALNIHAAILRAADKPATAEIAATTALTLARRLTLRREEIIALLTLGEIHRQLGNHQAATDWLEHAHSMATKYGFRRLAMRSQHALGRSLQV